MSVLSRLPADASAEQTAEACLAGLREILGGGLFAHEGQELLHELGAAVTELSRTGDRLAGMVAQDRCPECGADLGAEEDAEDAAPRAGDFNWTKAP